MTRVSILFAATLLTSAALAEPAPDHVDHKIYTVRISSTAARVGQQAQVDVTLEIRTGYHLNDDYPIHFTPDATANVKFAKARYDRDGMKHRVCFEGGHECGASVPVAFTADVAGATRIGGTLAFSACSDAQCLIEKIAVAAPISVAR